MFQDQSIYKKISLCALILHLPKHATNSYYSSFFSSAASVELSFPRTPERSIPSCEHKGKSCNTWNAISLRLQGRCSRFLLSSDLKTEPVTIEWDSFFLLSDLMLIRLDLSVSLRGCIDDWTSFCAWKLMRSHQNRWDEHKDIRRSNSLPGCIQTPLYLFLSR